MLAPRVNANADSREGARVETAGTTGKRRPILILLLLLLAAAAVAAVLMFTDVTDLLSGEDTQDSAPARDTAQAAIRDLEEDYEAEGEIRFVDQLDVGGEPTNSGTISWISQSGRSLSPGDTLYVWNDQPVVYMVGETPAWRTMAEEDVGLDVLQLEENLIALGYGTESDITVDDTFTSATETIVERWQEDLGLEQTGRVDLGLVVFGPNAARVGSVTGSVGSPATSEQLMVLSTANKEVVFTVPSDAKVTLAVGDEVEARQPDRTEVTVRIDQFTPIGQGQWEVIGSLVAAEKPADEQESSEQQTDEEGAQAGSDTLSSSDAIPVTVSWSEVVAADAVTVPADAVLRLDSGQHVVEVVESDGATTFVPVEVGKRFGTSVAIVGNVEADTTVVAP